MNQVLSFQERYNRILAEIMMDFGILGDHSYYGGIDIHDNVLKKLGRSFCKNGYHGRLSYFQECSCAVGLRDLHCMTCLGDMIITNVTESEFGSFEGTFAEEGKKTYVTAHLICENNCSFVYDDYVSSNDGYYDYNGNYYNVIYNGQLSDLICLLDDYANQLGY